MDRRGFLGSILALGAAPAIVRADSLMRVVPIDTAILLPDVDEYVITSVEAAGGGNTLVTMDIIAREALRIAHEKSTFIGRINQEYDFIFKKGDILTQVRGKPGDTIRIRNPNRYKRTAE